MRGAVTSTRVIPSWSGASLNMGSVLSTFNPHTAKQNAEGKLAYDIGQSSAASYSDVCWSY
jgi:hypothetical protein